ncbi:hypothetical protein QFY99_15220 [Sphingobacterium faecium]|nr:hypothetical protein [Sphingobacterium faecium]MDH5828003.1 hypothetical protein [Sphingobacterium faecium]
MKEGLLYTENQYLGRDRVWISVRLVLALFCFTAVYLNIDQLLSSQLFLLVGIAIIITSVVMMYLLLYRIEVFEGKVMLSGLWTTRLVKIELSSIVKVEKKPFSRFFFNNPVYNLHINGKIKFYAGGKDAVWLTDKDGLVYVIGTQRQEELFRAIQQAKVGNGNS